MVYSCRMKNELFLFVLLAILSVSTMQILPIIAFLVLLAWMVLQALRGPFH